PVNQMFFVGNNAGSVVGFATPLTAGETPSGILNSSFSAGNGQQQYGIAFDRFGNLYIASQVFPSSTLTSAVISVYTGPTVTSGQAAALTWTDVSISTPATIKLSKQMAIGP